MQPTMYDILALLDGTSTDPHRILGLHQGAVRTFCPNAASVQVLAGGKVYPAERVHEGGLFAAQIPETDYRLRLTDHTGHSWETEDPYRFWPTLGEMDRYLFGLGEHWRVYDKFGGRLCTRDGVAGAAFALWAPNARSVSLVGDFNQWDRRRNPMRLLPGGIWELFVPGLTEGDLYRFSIFQADGRIVEKLDPYGTFAAKRPATASILYDVDAYQWRDSRRRQVEGPVNVYEVHLGSWRADMTYVKAAEELVPYVKEMGYTHIELLPVMEHPFDGSWGYQVTGFYAPTSRYGTPRDFMYFVDTCHQAGLGVILDWVPAHFPKDEAGLGRFDGTPLYEHPDPRLGEHKGWGTYAFDYGRSQVRNFLIGNALFWAEKYHIDGLRVDAVAAILYRDYCREDWLPGENGGRVYEAGVRFIRDLNRKLAETHPHVLRIAEESTAWEGVTRPVDQGGLGFTYKWNMGWMNDFLFYVQKDPIYRKYHHTKLTFSMMYAYDEHFLLPLSHDEVVHGKSAMIGKMPGDIPEKFAGLKEVYGFMYGHPGKKLLFMGDEFAPFTEWRENRPLEWELLQYPHHQGVQQFLRDLNHLYLQEPAFWEQDFHPMGFRWIDCDDADVGVVSFLRFAENGNPLVFVCSFTPVARQNFRQGVPVGGQYQVLLNSADTKYGGPVPNPCKMLKSEPIACHGLADSLCLDLPPFGFLILKSC